ncbi:MAG: SDR family NAD(P)-dependent oxidoreductase, partial [Solirubrobacteraceae bacterium]
PIDLLVNGAGTLTTSPLIDLAVEDWDAVMAVNARGTFLGCKVFARQMIDAGQRASIVNISSISGRRGTAGIAHYCASKFAVIGLTQTAADELGAHKITVNAVCPGHVRTPMLSAVSDGLATPVDEFVNEQLIKVPQEPRDIGEAVVFLAAARNVTGQSLNVDGGWYLA